MIKHIVEPMDILKMTLKMSTSNEVMSAQSNIFYVSSELKSDFDPIKYKSAQHEAMSAQSNIFFICWLRIKKKVMLAQ